MQNMGGANETGILSTRNSLEKKEFRKRADKQTDNVGKLTKVQTNDKA